MKLKKKTTDRKERGADGSQAVSALLVTIHGHDDGPEIRPAVGEWTNKGLELQKRKKPESHVVLKVENEESEPNKTAMWDVRKSLLVKATKKSSAMVVLRLPTGDFDARKLKASKGVWFVDEGRQSGFLVCAMKAGGTISYTDGDGTHVITLGKDRRLIHCTVGKVQKLEPKADDAATS